MIPSSWTIPAKLCLCAAVLIVMSQATDADLLDRETIAMNTLRAATVDLSTLDTANNSQKSLFFNVQGLIPGGFQVNSVRIKNDGELDVMVEVTTQITQGQSELCSQLQLRVLQNWTTTYNNTLEPFRYETTISAGETEDLVFSLGLSGQSTLASSSCAFNFVVASTQEAGGGTIRFRDEETLQNQVATGQWSQ